MYQSCIILVTNQCAGYRFYCISNLVAVIFLAKESPCRIGKDIDRIAYIYGLVSGL